MVTPGELTVESLVISQSSPISLSEVLLADPLSVISLLIGSILIVVPTAVLGYLALGAVGDAISRNLGSLGRAPPRQE